MLSPQNEKLPSGEIIALTKTNYENVGLYAKAASKSVDEAANEILKIGMDALQMHLATSKFFKK